MEELIDTSANVVDQFNAKKVEVLLEFNKVDSALIHESSEYEAKSDPDWIRMTDELEKADHPMKDFFMDRQQRKLKMGLIKHHLISHIRVFGNLIIITLPGDVLSGFSKLIKESFPEHEVIILGYSNSYCNYMVPKEEYGLYFETYNSRLARNEADKFIYKVIDKVKNLLDK